MLTAGARAAWGKTQASEEQHDLQPGQEECFICMAAGVAVRFKPCDHGACLGCVENLRRTAVLGVGAPFTL